MAEAIRLGALKEGDPRPIVIRALNSSECEAFPLFTAQAVRARNCLMICKIVDRNFAEWNQHIKRLLQPEHLIEEELESDRLLMNFWASARAQIDHCRIYFREVHGREKQKVEFNGFIGRLCAQDWAFGFFQDLRDFALHHAITFPSFRKTVGDKSIVLAIELHTAELKKFEHRWKYCRLPEHDEALDLIKLTSLYYMRLRDDFQTFLAKWFVPHLAPPHDFFARLANEVGSAAGPDYKMCLITKMTSEGGKYAFSAQFPPLDLLGELGLRNSPKPQLGATTPKFRES